MEFVCRLGAPDGRIVEEVHEGRNADSVREELKRRGFHVFSVRSRGFGLSLSLPSLRRKRKIDPQRFLIFNQELATLLNAGLPLLQVLDLMIVRLKDPDFKNLMQDVRDRVEQGEELSTAFAAQGESIPALYSSSLMAGERSGELERVIRRYVRYAKLILDARKKVFSALVYPAALICLSIAMIAVMVIFVIPRFTVFYDELGAQLPLLTRATLAISQFFQDNLLWLLVGIVGGAFFLNRWRHTETGRLWLDRQRLRLPLLGVVFQRFACSEYCRALGTLLDGGLPLVPSLEIAVASVDNRYVRRQLGKTIVDVREGRALYESLDDSHVMEDLAVDMIRVGEATGALSTMLNNVSEFFDQEVEIRMERLLTLIEPIMLVIMGAIVALLLISVYLPMFTAIGQIQG